MDDGRSLNDGNNQEVFFGWGGEEKYRSFMQKRAAEYTYDGELNRKA